MSKLRNVHEHGEEYQGVMPQLFQAAGSYGLHEGMRKEGSVSACPECVESVSLKRIIKPRGPPRRREKLWVYRGRWEKRESPRLTKAWCRSLRGQRGVGQCLRMPLGITGVPPKQARICRRAAVEGLVWSAC